MSRVSLPSVSKTSLTGSIKDAMESRLGLLMAHDESHEELGYACVDARAERSSDISGLSVPYGDFDECDNVDHLAIAGPGPSIRQHGTLSIAKISWIVAGIAYPILFAYFLSIFFVGSANDLLLGTVNASPEQMFQMFELALAALLPAMVMILGLDMFFVLFRDESEVRSRHLGFIVHFCTAGTASIAVSVLLVAIICDVIPISREGGQYSPHTTVSFYLYLVLCMCSNLVLSSVVSRMRFMHKVFKRKHAKPSYWKGPLTHAALAVCVIPVPLTCHYASVECSLTTKISGQMVYSLVLGVIYVYYLVHTYLGASNMEFFVDFQSNVRQFVVWCVAFWGPTLYVSITQDRNFGVYMIFFLPPYCLWVFAIDNFLFVVIRVLSRKLLKRDHLVNFDLQGKYFNDLEGVQGVACLISHKETREMLLDYSKMRYCAETVEFMIEVRECVALEKTHPDVARQKAIRCVNKFVDVSSHERVNLSDPCRKRMEVLVATNVFKDMDDLFSQAFQDVGLLVSTNLVPQFLVSPQFLQHTSGLQNDENLMRALRNNGLLVPESREWDRRSSYMPSNIPMSTVQSIAIQRIAENSPAGSMRSSLGVDT